MVSVYNPELSVGDGEAIFIVLRRAGALESPLLLLSHCHLVIVHSLPLQSMFCFLFPSNYRYESLLDIGEEI